MLTDDLARLAADVGPPTSPAAARAELLIAAAHQTRSRDIWGGSRARTYWDVLPDRVRTCCYAGPTLGAWWERITRVLVCTQPREEDRADVAAALAAGDDRAVLDLLRTEAEMLCLRVRLAGQLAREARTVDQTPGEDF